MAHRADGLNDIFEHNVLIREDMDAAGGTVAHIPLQAKDIVNKEYVDGKVIESFPTNLTAGSVVFSDGSKLAEDNSNFFWDNVNKRLGIGTTSPEAGFDYIGTDGIALFGNTKDDMTIKRQRIGVNHYDNSEEPFLLWLGQSTLTSNTLDIGGGTNLGNAATQINFYTEANSTTTTGIRSLAIEPNKMSLFGTSPVFEVNDAGASSGLRLNVKGLNADGDNLFRLQDEGTTRVTVKRDGEFGIGVNPTSKLQVAGSMSLPIAAKTSNYTLTKLDYTILLDGTSNTVTATLPAASGITGRIYKLKSIDDTNQTDVATNGSETIDGSSTNFILSKDEVITIQSDGSNWWII